LNPHTIKLYIYAIDGSILAEHNNLHEGDFNHIYYGAKSDLDTKYVDLVWPWSDRWYLVANDDTRNILTTDGDGYRVNYSYPSWSWDNMVYRSGNDVWSSANWTATASHYCVSKAWDFYKQTALNRNGMTGWGKEVRVVAGYIKPNSFYNKKNGNDYILIGTKGNKLMATYDGVGHEFTHGVVENSKPLPYTKISGAVDESFADIFGFMVERYVFGYVRNWTIGEDAVTSRSLSNPNTYNCPSYYLQSPYWKDPNDPYDEGGVHFNSGVMNKWFHLLSSGSYQDIESQRRYVGGIGIDKAARIAYYTMINETNYSGSNLTFDAVRANSIKAAKILYGFCSNEYNQTCAAWYAVNVGVACMPCAQSNWYNNSNQSFTSSINEREASVINLTIFPNPAYEKISIRLEETNNDLNTNGYQLSVLDVSGKVLIQSTEKSINNKEVDIASLRRGVYFITITTDSWVRTTKFVKN